VAFSVQLRPLCHISTASNTAATSSCLLLLPCHLRRRQMTAAVAARRRACRRQCPFPTSPRVTPAARIPSAAGAGYTISTAWKLLAGRSWIGAGLPAAGGGEPAAPFSMCVSEARSRKPWRWSKLQRSRDDGFYGTGSVLHFTSSSNGAAESASGLHQLLVRRNDSSPATWKANRKANRKAKSEGQSGPSRRSRR